MRAPPPVFAMGGGMVNFWYWLLIAAGFYILWVADPPILKKGDRSAFEKLLVICLTAPDILYERVKLDTEAGPQPRRLFWERDLTLEFLRGFLADESHGRIATRLDLNAETSGLS